MGLSLPLAEIIRSCIHLYDVSISMGWILFISRDLNIITIHNRETLKRNYLANEYIQTLSNFCHIQIN